MIQCQINDQRIEVEVEMSILRAAKTKGIHIPHLCYMKNREPLTTCMLCVVEVLGIPHLVPSCAHPVEDGMVVKTQSERVKTARKRIAQLMKTESELKQSKQPKAYKNIKIDLSKCILCGRCLQYGLKYHGRGMNLKIHIPHDIEAFSNDQISKIIESCPRGVFL